MSPATTSRFAPARRRLAAAELLVAAGILVGLPACVDRPAPSDQAVRAASQASSADVAAAIRTIVVDGREPPGAPAEERTDLTALYEPIGYAPLWTDASGRPSRDADEALMLFARAGDEGLDPADYRDDRLERLALTLQTESAPPAGDVAQFDAALSAGMLRYVRHVHLGRVDPRAIGFRLSVPAESHDFAALVRSGVAGHQIAGTAATLAPPLAQYRQLREALTRYRSLAADRTLERAGPSTGVIHPGDQYAELPSLHRLLVAVGDMPADAPAPPVSSMYDGRLVDAVKRFQSRHGLDPDGVLGTRTQAALEVPLVWRVRQIDLALERLRWLPDLGDRRLVALNIPMFQLWAWDSIPPDGAPSFGMSVIVGRALDTETPVFVEEMREVIFRPYWNVPPSILRKEILPLLRRDPDYLRQQNMEIVRGQGDDALPVEATVENIARLAQGSLRLRQRPGPHNALGLVKFVFPNEENVYMHGTPAQALFARSRRDFSHGCVRVEDPVRLAEWALGEQPEWTRDRIVSAMAGTGSIHVRLQQPIQVILFYTTAAVMPEDGTIRFAEDIYGHDARLDRALARRRSTP